MRLCAFRHRPFRARRRRPALPAQAGIATSAEHAIIMDGETGQVLWSKDADAATPPASMSKLMTLELLFQRLKDGRVKLTDTLPRFAARLAYPRLQDVREPGLARAGRRR